MHNSVLAHEENSLTLQESLLFYTGQIDVDGMKTLFPSLSQGCINFGYWEKNCDNISLHERLSSQINLYKKIIQKLPLIENSSVLEVGCGRGHGVNLLSSLGTSVFGLDASPSHITICQNNYPKLINSFVHGDACNLPFNNQSFDIIFSLEAAQHFSDFLDFSKESYRTLEINGTLVVSTFFFTNDSAELTIDRLLPRNVLGVHNAISIQKAILYLKQAGFENITVQSIGAKVLEGFSNWAAQEKVKTEHSKYWGLAYKQNLLDYYIIKCNK